MCVVFPFKWCPSGNSVVFLYCTALYVLVGHGPCPHHPPWDAFREIVAAVQPLKVEPM